MSDFVIATFLMPDPGQLAEKRAKESGEAYLAWYDALSKGIAFAKASMIDPDALLILANSSERADQFLFVMEILNEHAKENPYGVNAYNLLAYYVDQSKYVLKSWLDALEYFYKWIGDNNCHASLESSLNYISGCIEDKTLIKGETLKNRVKAILDQYGFQD